MSEQTAHDELTEIFSQALELEPIEREKYLDEACQNKSHLRERVESLLKSFEKSEEFIETPVIQVSQIQPLKRNDLPTEPISQPINPKLLRGDLDNIILTALRKEPERRYASVGDFSADISNYLSGLPITARPNTFKYRTTKFVQRNLNAVISAILILVSLFAGSALLLYQNKMLFAAKNTAEREAVKSKKVTQFMETIMSYANPAWYAEGSKRKGETKLIEVIDDLSGKIENEFPDDLDVAAELHHKLAEIFVNKDFTDKALSHAERALELRRRFFGEKHAEVAKDLYYLGAVKFRRSESVEAAKFFDQAIEMFREIDPANANLPYLLDDAGVLAFKTSDTDKAEKYLTESLELFRRKDGENTYNTVRLLMYLSQCNIKKGDFAKADEFYKKGVEQFNQLADKNEQLIVLMSQVLTAKGDLAEAQTLLENNFSIRDCAKDNVVFQAFRTFFDESDNYEKLIELFKGQIETENRNPLPNLKNIEKAKLEIAVNYFRLGKFSEGKPYFEEVFQSFKQSPDKYEFVFFGEVGECLFHLKRYKDAEPLLQNALDKSNAKIQPDKDQERVVEMLEKIRGGLRKTMAL